MNVWVPVPLAATACTEPSPHSTRHEVTGREPAEVTVARSDSAPPSEAGPTWARASATGTSAAVTVTNRLRVPPSVSRRTARTVCGPPEVRYAAGTPTAWVAGRLARSTVPSLSKS